MVSAVSVRWMRLLSVRVLYFSTIVSGAWSPFNGVKLCMSYGTKTLVDVPSGGLSVVTAL